MKLVKFKVTNFRSVDDSGWIEADDVTVLIGTNESGKTNVILPLWKLNPAKEGAVIATSDYPRKSYNDFRTQEPKPIFISAIFKLDDSFAKELSIKSGLPIDNFQEVQVSRRFDGTYLVSFVNVNILRTVKKEEIEKILIDAEAHLSEISALKSEEDIKGLLISSLQTVRKSLQLFEEVGEEQIRGMLTTLSAVKTDTAPKSGGVVPCFLSIRSRIEALVTEITKKHPNDIEELKDLVISRLPKFVYYSTYGNLDSDIYLPHVINNMARTDLGIKEAAKARTLKVLFEFVNLSPQEILELGRDFKDPNRQPTSDEVAKIAEKKKERSILLQSASTMLTKQFREWWKQGEYRFRFEADGDHFRIWVSDDKRPEEIELEGRSTGLQWFLSFYLVFLVERADAHENAILLLDEPGLSLHPLAQQDLSKFFDGLAKDNQLIYTSHSPFLVEADRLDRARKVYISKDGVSKVTSDLRASDDESSQKGASYAVNAALGLSVAESLLLGCEPVIVEGPSDQHYLTAIKILLNSAGKLNIGRELLFPPAGGAKGVKVVANLLGSRDEQLPIALFDSDTLGDETVRSLRKDLYADFPKLVFQIDTFTGMAGSEIEDLIPSSLIITQLDKWQRGAAVPFSEKYISGMPIVPQIEKWSKEYNISLSSPGWKVDLAKRVKQQLISDGYGAIAPEYIERWVELFNAFRNRGSM